MSTEIWIALLSFLGTVIGSLFGVVTASKLTSYRIEQLEKKVEKHNNIVERVFVVERDIKTAFNRIDELKADVKVIELEELKK